VLSPSSAAEAAKKKETSRLQQMREAAANAGISPMAVAVMISGLMVCFAILFVCFHNKKRSAAASAENSNDLEQPKAVVELTANPMKQAK
jgi:hypothetical protein